MTDPQALLAEQAAPLFGHYIEAEGLVHFVNAIQAEFTLCGDAFDLASDVPGYQWKPRRRGPVTCPSCAAVIESCRGVRTRTEQKR